MNMKKKTVASTVLCSVSLLGVGLISLVLQAGGWEDFKLRYYSLTQYFHNQAQELEVIRKQNLDLAEQTRIELGQLLNGGPPKDGIPSVDNPRFDTPEMTPFGREERVIGIVVNGEAKAYPIGIMNWHEIVNDTVGGSNVTVSYCPLCDTIVAVERGSTTYGVSGKLYQSCLVMYDRADETLYAQPWALGIVGANVDRELDRVPAVKTTLGQWLDAYPESQILSTDTGYNRDYQSYPYGSYYTNDDIIFPVRNQDERSLHPKAIVSYIWEADDQTPHNKFSGDSHQFVHEQMRSAESQIVEFGDRQVRAQWDSALETVVVEELDGTIVPSSTAFAFVYPSFFAKPN